MCQINWRWLHCTMWHLSFVSMYVINNFESSGLSRLLQPHKLKQLSGGVLTTWSLTCLKQWRSWTSGCPSGYPPPPPPLTAMNSSVAAVESDSWAPQFLRTWTGTITLSPWWKRPSRGCTSFVLLRKFNLPQEQLIQLYSDIIESILCMSITVWFSSATEIWPQKTTEGSPECWMNHWYNPPHSPGYWNYQ